MSPLPEILFAIPRNPILAVGLPVILGGASGYFSATRTKSQSEWYTTMTPPPGSPPKEAFGPVWTLLYAGMGYASHLAVKAFDAAATPQSTKTADIALQLYYAQLGLNLLWSPLFFGAEQKTLALVNITALTGTVITMTSYMSDLNTYPISTNYLLIPYCAWLGYASYLNAGYVFLNWDKPGKRIP